MKKKNILLYIGVSLFALTSCSGYLDKMPDNRTMIDTENDVVNILTSAYPENDYMLLTEFMSDNVDDYGENNPNTDRFIDQVYHWNDVTEEDNESPESVWEAYYKAIANANQALDAIGTLEKEKELSRTLQEAKGEALLCRAYNHFILVNMFSKNYSTTTSSKDLGIPYATTPETKLAPKHDRGTVAEDYEKIEADLEEGLQLIGDNHYTVPKYHFNVQAAYAFAARFYLYYEKWDKAVEYATLCLGSHPQTQLRDWKYVSTMAQTREAVSNHYIDATLNANLLLITAYSKMGLTFENYATYAKYSHGSYLASHEDANANNIWGDASFYSPIRVYQGTNMDRVIFWKLPYIFEYDDPVAETGFYRTVYPAFTTDEALLNRAEAYIMLKQYDKAAADLTTWMQNIIKTNQVLTPESITAFYAPVAYSYSDKAGLESTIKKHLNPSFAIDKEGSTQESMLQCVLGFRRVETLGNGLRWFDVKRYGIEIVRRVMNEKGVPSELVDKLGKDDERRAIQIPLKVRQGGLEANPR